MGYKGKKVEKQQLNPQASYSSYFDGEVAHYEFSWEAHQILSPVRRQLVKTSLKNKGLSMILRAAPSTPSR